MASPTRQKPNKVLSARVLSQVELDAWPNPDFSGDPWWTGGATPRPYRWQLELSVYQVTHGDPTTRVPDRYNGIDINVGNWITDTVGGISLKITAIIDKTDSTATVVVEDVDRYNTFLSESGVGIFPVPGDAVIFEINDMRMPILNPIPVNVVSLTFSQEVMGRFQNNNPLYRTRVFQAAHGLLDSHSIWVDPADGLFKVVTDDDELKRMVGTVDQSGPGPDIFYFAPTTRVVEGIDPPLPGSAGELIYVDGLTGELTTNPTDKTKVAYIQLTNATSDTTSSTGNTVVQSSILGINNTNVTFTGTTMQSVVDDINLLSGLSSVTSTLETGVNTAVSDPAQLSYAICACIGTSAVATFNGVTVNFDDDTNGFIEYGFSAVNAVDMANSINAASIPDITAVGVGSAILTITHATGGAITIVNVTPDDSAIPYAGNASCCGVPLSTGAGGMDFIEFTNIVGTGIIFQNVLGAPVDELGLTSVRNGDLPVGLVVEQYVTSGGVTVYPVLADLPLTATVGEQAYVIDSDDGSGNHANEWTMFLWDGFGWVDTSNEDSAATDARTFKEFVDFDSASPITIGTLSNGRRVSEIIVEIITIFDGAPTLNIGDAGDTARLMPDSFIDLSVTDTFAVTTDFVYSTGNDTTVIATFTPGGATQGRCKVIITYV